MRERIIVRDMISTAEAATAMRVARNTLNAWRQRDVGPPYFKLAGVIFYDRAELRSWFETRRHEPQPDTKPATRRRNAAASRRRKAAQTRCHKDDATVGATA